MDSLIAVAGTVGVERLVDRFQDRLSAGLINLPMMSPSAARLEAHSLRGSAMLLGLSALAEALRAVEDGADWSAHGQSVENLSTTSVAAVRRMLDERTQTSLRSYRHRAERGSPDYD